VTYLLWTIDSAITRIAPQLQPFVQQLSERRDARLLHDWDTELTEAEAERENWEPGVRAYKRPSLDYFA
jgi:hypothetical protein